MPDPAVASASGKRQAASQWSPGAAAKADKGPVWSQHGGRGAAQAPRLEFRRLGESSPVLRLAECSLTWLLALCPHPLHSTSKQSEARRQPGSSRVADGQSDSASKDRKQERDGGTNSECRSSSLDLV